MQRAEEYDHMSKRPTGMANYLKKWAVLTSIWKWSRGNILVGGISSWMKRNISKFPRYHLTAQTCKTQNISHLQGIVIEETHTPHSCRLLGLHQFTAVCGWDLVECGWDLAELWIRSSRVWMISSPVWMIYSPVWMISSRVWMRSNRVVDEI